MLRNLDTGTSIPEMALRPAMKLTLQQVNITNFKAIHLNGLVSLHPFTVIIGRNGAGKSSVLEALQLVATACREDVVRAFDKFQGISEVINKKATPTRQYVGITTKWNVDDGRHQVDWAVQIGRANEDRLPFVLKEELTASGLPVIKTISKGRAATGQGARRVLFPKDPRRSKDVDSADTLAVAESVRHNPAEANGVVDALHSVREFWRGTVFLRLSPASLADGSPPKRKSFEPILSEDGSSLPQLLAELGEAGRKKVAVDVQRCLKDVVGVKVSDAKSSHDVIHFSLTEQMRRYGGRPVQPFDVPAWLLSEGTRRLTALFALMAREQPPSLLMVEEVENGLDPWSTLELLRHLQEASTRMQVVITTHSPWLLNHVDVDSVLLAERGKGITKYARLKDRKGKGAFADLPAGIMYVESDGGPQP